jgi:hypothetical protein
VVLNIGTTRPIFRLHLCQLDEGVRPRAAFIQQLVASWKKGMTASGPAAICCVSLGPFEIGHPCSASCFSRKACADGKLLRLRLLNRHKICEARSVG